MGGILDKLDEWLRGLLIEGITGNLSGMFDTVNTKVGEIAGEVGQTPAINCFIPWLLEAGLSWP